MGLAAAGYGKKHENKCVFLQKIKIDCSDTTKFPNAADLAKIISSHSAAPFESVSFGVSLQEQFRLSRLIFSFPQALGQVSLCFL